MTVVDANVLLYAVDESALHHERANRWLREALGGTATVVLPWVSLLAFLRISTNPKIYPQSLEIEEAISLLDSWLSRPNVIHGVSAQGHWRALKPLLQELGTGGNLVTDAHIAAVAVELDAVVVTFDNDFGRFPGVRWQAPPR